MKWSDFGCIILIIIMIPIVLIVLGKLGGGVSLGALSNAYSLIGFRGQSYVMWIILIFVFLIGWKFIIKRGK